jgi:hypothetical protein
MRLICPHCMSGVTVSDDAAGKEATCPNCGKSFPTPPRYSASVVPEPPPSSTALTVPDTAPRPYTAPPPHSAPPPAPAGYVPPGQAVPPVEPSGFLPPPVPPSAEVPALAGYTKTCGITISPHVVAWLPAVLLTLTLVFTFFPWVGSYAGRTAVYWQRPWGAAFGASPGRDFALEKVIAPQSEWLNKVRSDWELMIPYLLLLLLVTALAWADRGVHALDPRKVPPLATVWEHRQTVIFGLAGFVFVLALFQVSNGFGMERAIRKQIAEDFAARRQQAENNPQEQARLEYEMEQRYLQYHLEHTSWMYLALACNLLAVLAVVVRLVLDRRENKPPPKLLLHY